MTAVRKPGLRLSSLNGFSVALICYVFFSASDAAVKALGSRLSAFEAAAIIALIGLMLTPLIKQRNEDWRQVLTVRRPWLVLLRALAGSGASVFSVTAFTSIPFAEAYAVIFLAPLIALVLSVVFLREQVRWRRWSAVLVGFAGVLIVVRPGFRALGMGHLTAAAAAVCIAVALLSIRALGTRERPATIYWVLMAVSALVPLPLLLLAGHPQLPDGREAILLVVSGLAAGAGHVIYMAAVRRSPASEVAPIQYSQLGWAILNGAVFFREVPDAPTFAGLGLIAAAGLFLIQRKPRQAVPLPGVP